MKPADQKSSQAGRAPNFDRLAKIYRWMEWCSFGPYLARCRTAFLSDFAGCRRALVLGDGDGRFTAALLRANPAVQVDAVDASPAMLDALVRNAAMHRARVHTERADIRTWQPCEQSYDLIATHFFLDCLTTEEVQALAAKLRTVMAEHGIWNISDFSVPEGRFGQLAGRPLVGLLYRAFGVLTGLGVRALPDHKSVLRAAGFRLSRQKTHINALLFSELWSPEPRRE